MLEQIPRAVAEIFYRMYFIRNISATGLGLCLGTLFFELLSEVESTGEANKDLSTKTKDQFFIRP
jgi:hypothetical protein